VTDNKTVPDKNITSPEHGTMKRCPVEIISQQDNPDFSCHHLGVVRDL
jgi:hypothetical protein